jgi:hypothetical protein
MFADGMRASTAAETDSDSDSGTTDEEEELLEIKKSKKYFSASMTRDQPNLAEPRSLQGVNGDCITVASAQSLRLMIHTCQVNECVYSVLYPDL